MMGNFTQDESFQHADDADDDGRNEEILLKSVRHDFLLHGLI